jgi:hypothetical protein
VSSTTFLDIASIIITFLQSLPPSEMAYATFEPSFEKSIPPSEVVPSLEKY